MEELQGGHVKGEREEEEKEKSKLKNTSEKQNIGDRKKKQTTQHQGSNETSVTGDVVIPPAVIFPVGSNIVLSIVPECMFEVSVHEFLSNVMTDNCMLFLSTRYKYLYLFS